ncbi:unnamed protein product [Medioppia subpectinata]|uniref:C2H2-type domain-containing protein n=1 Tax=Medioppia subpectinata TaxID=1979941 RepID=A0A7R9KDU7_9ACAR|nr:unnamed protein product [Medioppia subpectinata]CAG2101709.1 unnamed protein product [Medioppia subpectinata]
MVTVRLLCYQPNGSIINDLVEELSEEIQSLRKELSFERQLNEMLENIAKYSLKTTLEELNQLSPQEVHRLEELESELNVIINETQHKRKWFPEDTPFRDNPRLGSDVNTRVDHMTVGTTGRPLIERQTHDMNEDINGSDDDIKPVLTPESDCISLSFTQELAEEMSSIDNTVDNVSIVSKTSLVLSGNRVPEQQNRGNRLCLQSKSIQRLRQLSAQKRMCSSKASKESPVQCSFTSCDQSFETLSEYHKHLDEIHCKYRCIVCAKSFADKELLEIHQTFCRPIVSQSSLKRKSCPEEDNSIEEIVVSNIDITLDDTIDDNMNDTIVTTSTPQIKPADNSPVVSTQLSTSQAKSGKTVSEDTTDTHICTKCLKTFETLKELVSHQRWCRLKTYQINRYKCSFISCNQWFKTLDEYHNHLREIHLKHKCIECQKFFASPELLSKHQISCERNVVLKRFEVIKQNTDNNQVMETLDNSCLSKSTGGQLIQTKRQLSRVKKSNQLDFTQCQCIITGCVHRFKTVEEYNSHLVEEHKSCPVIPSDGSSYQCIFTSCGQRFETSDEYNKHLREIHLKHNCNKCQKVFASPDLLTKYHSCPPKPFKCPIDWCDRSYQSESQLTDHVNKHNGLRPYRCTHEDCGREFLRPHDRRLHMKTVHSFVADDESKLKQFPCPHDGCDRICKSLADLRKHVQTVHSTREYRCDWPGCEHITHTEYLLNTHQRVHSDDKPFKCEWKGCDFRGKFQSTIWYHRQRAHITDRPFACDWPQCGRRFKVKFRLKAHRSVHKGLVPPTPQSGTHPPTAEDYVCAHEDCGQRFATKIQFDCHVRAEHPMDRPFACDYQNCGKRFKTRNHLMHHKRAVHTTVGHHIRCPKPGCGRTYKTNTDLRKHVKTVHTNREYPCDWPDCQFRTHTQSLLDNHRLIHSDDKPYACDWPACEHRCRSTSQLWSHKRTHDDNKPVACDWPGFSLSTSSPIQSLEVKLTFSSRRIEGSDRKPLHALHWHSCRHHFWPIGGPSHFQRHLNGL